MDTQACDFGNAVRAGHGPDPTPVIADSGRSVRVSLVEFLVPPAVGDRFTFDGLTWVVVQAKGHARGYVARPCGADRRSRDLDAS